MEISKNREKFTQQSLNISEWGLRTGKYLLFVGGLNKHEGVHYLIEAFKQLEDTARTPNNFKLVVVAAGEDDVDYVKYLHTIIEGRANIIFFCARKGNFIKQLMSHTYLYVQPAENVLVKQNLNLLEVMRQGICVLASDILENKKLLGDAGYIFKAKNVVDLKNKLAYLLNKPGEVKALGELAKKLIQMEYSKDLIAEETKK